MTLNMIIDIGIGLLLAWRVRIIAVRVWRAWARHEEQADAEQQRVFNRIMQANCPPRASGLRQDSRKVGR